MMKTDFNIPKEYVVVFRFLFWTAAGTGIFFALMLISFWAGFVDAVAWIFLKIINKFELHSLVDDDQSLLFVVHTVPMLIQAVGAGAVAGGVLGYTIRSPFDLRAVVLGGLLAYAISQVLPVIHFTRIYEAAAAAKEGDPEIRMMEMRGVSKSEALEGIALVVNGGLELMKINLLMFSSSLFSIYFFRRVSGAKRINSLVGGW
ncbi:MAG TPA: hypothetical protein VF268_06735 [Gammaproteobacteria bacterium]